MIKVTIDHNKGWIIATKGTNVRAIRINKRKVKK